MKEEEKVCGECMYFEPTTYAFVGKGVCINQKNTFCHKRVWNDFRACENFIADMRGEE